MEVPKKEPVREPEPRVLSDNKDTNGVLAQENKKKREKKEVMKRECKTRKEQEKESQQRILDLQRDITGFIADFKTAVDAKAVQKRTQLNEANEVRAGLLENDVKSSQEMFDEIERGWLLVSQKENLPDLQKALNKQQELCAVLIQDKKNLIDELQKELKLADDCYVKDLRKNAEEIDLIIERMEDQIKTLTQTYREELAQMERVHQEELESLPSEDITKWDEDLKELREKELKRALERREKVEEYEEEINEQRFKNACRAEALDLEKVAKMQNQIREYEKQKCFNALEDLKLHVLNDEALLCKISVLDTKYNLYRCEQERQKLKQAYRKIDEESSKQIRVLSGENKRQVQRYERLTKQINYFGVFDARQYDEMWLMIDADLKQLAERALLIDSVISKQLLGLPWEKPPLASLEVPHPRRSQEPAGNSGCGPEREEKSFFSETQKKVMELVCHETDFMMETNVLKLLRPLENEEQTNMKLVTLLYSLGLNDKDVPELTSFLLNYEQQQKEQNMGACAESSDLAEAAESRATTNSAPELINPINVLPALKSFLEHKGRRRPGRKDCSETEAYWESLGNVVSEEKLQLWGAAEKTLKEYHAVLTDISDLTLKTDRLKRRNSELRMQLQQQHAPTV